MDEKLLILFEQIKFEEKYFSSFCDAKLKKVIVSKKKSHWTFVIEKEEILDVSIMKEFYKKLKKSFSNIKEIELKMEINNLDDSKVIEYYPYILDLLKPKYKLATIYSDNLVCEEDQYFIIVNNSHEKEQVKEFLKDLNRYLLIFGFDLEIHVKVEDKKTVLEEIKKDLEKQEVKPIKHSNYEEKDINNKKQFSYTRKERVREESSILGRVIKDESSSISEIEMEENNITIEGYVFGVDLFESSKSNFKIITLKMTDYTDSILVKVFVNDEDEYIRLCKELKKGKWLKVRGSIKDDMFAKELVVNARDINEVKKEEDKRVDDEEEKRIELHTHTKMSQMDGLNDEVALVKQAMAWGHKAIAITDHDGCQAFPHVYNTISSANKGKEEKDKFKGIYGVELEMSDDTLEVVMRPNESSLMNSTYVVFDTETTGFNPGLSDSMIEIGAVKMEHGMIVDRFDELINPGKPIDESITALTGISDSMVKDCDDEETVTKKFKEWIGDLPLVAHNAKFDINMLKMAYYKYELGELNNSVLDTLIISQLINKGLKRHNLTALAKNYGINFEENDNEGDDLSSNNSSHHHRADYDAENTGYIFYKMLKQMEDQIPDVKTFNDLYKLPTEEDINSLNREVHVNLLAKTRVGLKNLFKIISFASCKYIVKNARIPRHVLDEYREDVLVGSGCYNSEIFKLALTATEDELKEAMKFYDYIEVQPKDNYYHLLVRHDISSEEDLILALKKIIKCAYDIGKIVVATSDAHTLNKEDKIYREIIVNQNVPGKGRHPLARYLNIEGYETIPDQYFRTTKEMLDAFDFLDEKTRREVVIYNTWKIADMIEEFEVIIATPNPFSPKIDNSANIVRNMVYDKAHSIYGNPLPELIEKRITDELNGIIGGGFDVIYLIAQKLVKHSNDEGYLVGSRGSVGSSFVATMMGITEVNPLPAHYVCPKCKHSIFTDDNGEMLGATYSSGFDLKDKKCPKCNTPMEKNGQDMPFATFLGFNADKVPDIDLNFSGDNQASAHEYTKVLFGVDNVYRAGTIGTVADKTAYGFVLGYYEDKEILKGRKKFKEEIRPIIDKALMTLSPSDISEAEEIIDKYSNDTRIFPTFDQVIKLHNELKKAQGFEIPRGGKNPDDAKARPIKIEKRSVEIERIALGCTGVKRTTGQHPGGIVVVPGYMDVYDFTPYQFPADDVTSPWRTTHFDYHAIDQDLLKLDILGHDDPTVLRMLQDLSGMDVTKVPLDDQDTMSIFTSPNILGVSEEDIMCPTGTLGIPEFGTKFVIQMLVDTKPTTFSELIKISGLSHGTDVWLGNAQELIKNDIVPFKEVIGCRDDIMVYLSYHGVEPLKAFKIMEFVRKGRASKDPEMWKEYEQLMKDSNIEPWFIDSCHKIKYMFPKAHAAAYVISAYRIAWFKVHHPIWYYAAYFSIRCSDFDIDTMIRGYNAIKNKVMQINEKGYGASNKENAVLGVLELAMEATARGIKFAPISLEKSDSMKFVIDDDNTLIPPFRTIDGLGDTVAQLIVEERKKKPFISVDDLQKRAKVSKTLIDRMKAMGILEDLPESNQLSLF